MSHEPTAVHDDIELLGVAAVAGLLAGLTRPLAGVLVADVGAAPVDLHHATAGLSTLALALHLVYSVAFGAVFVGALAWAVPDRLRRGPAAVLLLGLAYGGVLWLVNVAVGWPLLQSALGLGVHHVPHLHTGPLVVHLLYGLVLGGVVTAVVR